MSKIQWSHSKNTMQIYNLEFPPYIEEFKMGDYIFKRTEKYEEAFDNMMHLVNSSGSEFNTEIQTGSHKITATVIIPQKEKKIYYHEKINKQNKLMMFYFYYQYLQEEMCSKKLGR